MNPSFSFARVTLAGLLVVAAAAGQSTWYVEGDGTPGGSGTAADPFGSIQQALVAAGPGGFFGNDQVLVAPGTYREALDFLGKDVHVLAVAGPEQTRLLGPGGPTVAFGSGEGPGAILEGFTVSHDARVAWVGRDQQAVTFAADGHLASLDVDDDGLPDAIVWGEGGQTIRWLRNDGVGLEAAADLYADPAVPIPFGATAFGAGDVDGDGRRDFAIWLVVSGGTLGDLATLTVYRNQGGGVFLSSNLISLGSAPVREDLVVIDVDGDGNRDLAWKTASDVQWIANQGGGTFAATPQLLGLSGVSRVHDPADVDGDGMSELVYVDGGGLKVRSPGGAATTSLPVGGSVLAVASGDADGDGRDELFASSTGTALRRFDFGAAGPTWFDLPASFPSTDFAVVRARPEGARGLVSLRGGLEWSADAAGPLVPITGVPTQAMLRLDGAPGSEDRLVSIRAGRALLHRAGPAVIGFVGTVPRGPTVQGPSDFGDWDGDGDLDLLSSTRGTSNDVRFHENLGDGSFAAPVTVATAAGDVDALCCGDFDGDGRDEVATLTYTASGSGLCAGGTAIVTTEVTVHDPTAGATVIESSFNSVFCNPGLCFSATWLLQATTIRIRAVDADDDGLVDVVTETAYRYDVMGTGSFPSCSSTTTSTSRRVRLFRNLGSGMLSTGNTLGIGDRSTVGDLDGDGLTDVVIADGSQAFWIAGQGGGSFGSGIAVPVSAAVREIEAVDLDADGDLDLAVVLDPPGSAQEIAWLENVNGDASVFVEHTLLTQTGSQGRLSVADHDLDGLPDVAVQQGAELRWLRNLGAGAFDAGLVLDPAATTSPALRSVDVDGDGDADLFGARWYRNGDGPGIRTSGGAAPRVLGCVVRGNDTVEGGAGLDVAGGSPELAYCTLAGNESLGGAGGAVRVDGGSPVLDHCTLVANRAAGGGGAVDLASGAATLIDSILWQNGASPVQGGASITHSDVEGGAPGTGNLDQDPRFLAAPVGLGLDATAGDLRLRGDSPCVGAASGGDTMGAYEAGFALWYEQSAPSALDIRHAGGPPGGTYLWVITTAAANAGGGLGSGWFSGLHCTVDDVLTSIEAGAPPFVGTLDASGAALFGFPPGSISPFLGGFTFYSVTHAIDPVLGQVVEVTPPVAYTLQ